MKYAIITDHNVQTLYGKYFQIPVFSFPPGEAHKTRATKEALEDGLIEAGFSRDTTLIGVGGGVVTDMAGFLAATFCRGVPLVLIPTTLVAMVDAAIGGKNGVNTPLGKNLIGTFYLPHKVLIEPLFLKTLPENELWNGKVEMLKCGLIGNPDLFEMDIRHTVRFDESSSESFASQRIARSCKLSEFVAPSAMLLGRKISPPKFTKSNRVPYNFEAFIFSAIEVKRRIVSRDLNEQGLRRLLNFGHTIGHAIELLSDYKISHGEAVAAGIVIESRLSYEMGILDLTSLEKIEKKLPPVSLPFDPNQILSVLSRDKKSLHSTPRFVLLRTIGEALPCDGDYCAPVPEPILRKVLHDASLCSIRR